MSAQRTPPQRTAPRLAWCVAIAFAMTSGCATHTNESSISRREMVSRVNSSAISNASSLHLVNIGDISHLQEVLRDILYYDILALSDSLTYQGISHDEREKIQKTLTLLAVQNEKFPVPKWTADAQIVAILNAALAQNAEFASQLRARNWTKPWWQE